MYIVARDLLKATAENVGWDESASAGHVSRDRSWKARYSAIRSWSAIRSASWPTTSRSSRARARSTLRPATARKTTSSARKYGINTYCPVDAAGRFFHAEGADGRLPEELIGKTVWEANPIVIGILEQHGALLAMKKVEHSYPHCWRCHNPTIFRATEQWFIGMDRNDLRQRALEAIRKVKWIPAWGEDRIHNMIAEPSRLVHLAPAHLGRADHRVLLRRLPRAGHGSQDSRRRGEAFRASTSADIWYERTAAELMPAGTKCAKCGGTRVQQRKRHPRRLVRLRLQPSRRPDAAIRTAMARRYVPGRRRPISRLVP